MILFFLYIFTCSYYFESCLKCTSFLVVYKNIWRSTINPQSILTIRILHNILLLPKKHLLSQLLLFQLNQSKILQIMLRLSLSDCQESLTFTHFAYPIEILVKDWKVTGKRYDWFFKSLKLPALFVIVRNLIILQRLYSGKTVP